VHFRRRERLPSCGERYGERVRGIHRREPGVAQTATTAAGVAAGVLAALGIARLWLWLRGFGELQLDELEVDDLEVDELEVDELEVDELKVDRLVVRELVVEQRAGPSEPGATEGE
jgi:hypothetical protein